MNVSKLVPLIPFAALACTQPTESSRETTNLGTASGFLVLAASTVTNTGATVILGDLGLHPGTAISGFPPAFVEGEIHLADGAASQAQTDLHIAWNTFNAEPCDHTLDNPELGGVVLTPGVYCFASPSAGLTGQLTLDAEGDADARFVFKIASTITTASDSSVIRINGGNDCNTYWVIGSSATIGTGSEFRGSILAEASITVTTDATVSGRLLAHTGAVTLDHNTISLDCEDDAGGPDGGVPDIEADAGIEQPGCGDGTLAEGEQCDDGNIIDFDGCSAICGIELQPPPPSICGNGIIELGEQCDDGNDINTDGCANSCSVGT